MSRIGLLWLTWFFLTLGTSQFLFAGIMFEPYYSFKSNKSLVTNRSNGTEKEVIRNREEKGINAGVKLWRLLKIQASIGQSFAKKTTTYNEIEDEYDEIDYAKDLSIDTENDSSLLVKETDTRANLSVLIDPSFWIFVFRAKFGVTARQRKVTTYEDDVLIESINPEITYKPKASLGLGLKFSYKIYAIAEYEFYLYKFPQTEPFEKGLSVSVGFSI